MRRRSAAASCRASSEHEGTDALSALLDTLAFVVGTLLNLALFVALLRLFLQWSRADFRNPISQAVVRLTNPLVMPLRRILPPVGKIDTASVVTVAIVALVDVAVIAGLRGYEPAIDAWLRDAAILILRISLWTYFSAIFLYALLSLIAPGGYSPVQSLLTSRSCVPFAA